MSLPALDYDKLKFIATPFGMSDSCEMELICDGQNGCRIEAEVCVEIDGKIVWFDMKMTLMSGIAQFVGTDALRLPDVADEDLVSPKGYGFKFMNHTAQDIDLEVEGHNYALAEVSSSPWAKEMFKFMGSLWNPKNIKGLEAELSYRHFVLFGRYEHVEFLVQNRDMDKVRFEFKTVRPVIK